MQYSATSGSCRRAMRMLALSLTDTYLFGLQTGWPAPQGVGVFLRRHCSLSELIFKPMSDGICSDCGRLSFGSSTMLRLSLRQTFGPERSMIASACLQALSRFFELWLSLLASAPRARSTFVD